MGAHPFRPTLLHTLSSFYVYLVYYFYNSCLSIYSYHSFILSIHILPFYTINHKHTLSVYPFYTLPGHLYPAYTTLTLHFCTILLPYTSIINPYPPFSSFLYPYPILLYYTPTLPILSNPPTLPFYPIFMPF